MISGIEELLGHLHPLLVHLPLGILLVAIVFYWLSRKEKYRTLRDAVPLLFLLGAVTAIFSCVTGYLLAEAEAYEKNLRNWHQWMGISTALISIALYYAFRVNAAALQINLLSLLLLVLLFITGHLGGSLTHGADYLSKPMAEIMGHKEKVKPVFSKPMPAIAEAVVYRDLVHPILEARCVSCHGEQKQKGELRLDDPEGLMKGGKTGKAIVPGKPDLGELIKRITLSQENKDHMPPKNKAQLTDNEIILLKWWIADSADFDQKVKSMPQAASVRSALLALQEGVDTQAIKISDVPDASVSAASENLLNALRSHGVVVLPVARNSNYLSVSFVTATLNDSLLGVLFKISDQLVWLNLGGTALTDQQLEKVGRLTRLTRLYLNDTKITDSGLHYLQSLQQLQYLNLVHTQTSAKGLAQLHGLKWLKQVFAYQTNLHAADWESLRKSLPGVKIDTGGYLVPTLAGDTTIYKGPKK
ncbi:MAG TPA: c-type cytochrome domain-containing protein [Puia sp.]|nr:c-type cytochrome domain-containing protein [Puia sp.]